MRSDKLSKRFQDHQAGSKHALLQQSYKPWLTIDAENLIHSLNDVLKKILDHFCSFSYR